MASMAFWLGYYRNYNYIDSSSKILYLEGLSKRFQDLISILGYSANILIAITWCLDIIYGYVVKEINFLWFFALPSLNILMKLRNLQMNFFIPQVQLDWSPCRLIDGRKTHRKTSNWSNSTGCRCFLRFLLTGRSPGVFSGLCSRQCNRG